ncbi:hypothetical protein MRY87_10535 [bacterium]|nr:hypothetical protein [bacterium]
MSDTATAEGGGSNKLSPWKWEEVIPFLSQSEVTFSQGFLRCRPEQWFPGFSAHWQPIFHSLNLDIEVGEVRPVLQLPVGESSLFLGSLHGEELGLLVNARLFEFVSRTYIPEAPLLAKHLLVEYFARRFLSTLVRSWSGQMEADFRFESERVLSGQQFPGGVTVSFRANGEPFSLEIGLGEKILHRLQELWIAQAVQGAGPTTTDKTLPLRLVLGGTYLSPSEIGQQLVVGNTLPLSFGGVRDASLLLHDEPWMKGELCAVGSGESPQWGVRVVGEGDERPLSPSGMTPVLYELGESDIGRTEMMLLSQPGANHGFSSQVDEPVRIVISGQVVARGRLRVRLGDENSSRSTQTLAPLLVEVLTVE